MFLGIDLGTSSVKTVLCDAELREVAEASVPLALSHPKPGWAEQDPQDWWTACVQAVRALGGTAGVKAIGLSGQMHGAVLLDAQHQPLRPAILWNDSRAQTECVSLRDTQLEHAAGVQAMPGFTGPKLAWLRHADPETYSALRYILSPKDYIGLRLHGAVSTDLSDAAGTWWLDQAKGHWSEALCQATGVSPDWLPPILPSHAIAGTLSSASAQRLGLPRGIPVAAGAGDTVAGAVSLGAEQEGAGFVSLGTSGQLFVATQTFATAPEKALHSFAHIRPGLWYQMAAMLNGARPMAWLAEVTKAPMADLLAEAGSAPSQKAPLCLPYLTGERTPHCDTNIRGAFVGIGNDTSRGALMRAVIDAIAYSFADARDAVSAARPLPDRLRVIGGGARSDLLVQTIADVTGLSLMRGSDAAQGPALGAARLAARAIGQEPPLEAPQLQVFTPQDTPWHPPRLSQYRALYQALKPLGPV